MFVMQLLACNMQICLIVASAAEKIEIPFAGKTCLKESLCPVFESISYHKFLFPKGNKERLSEKYLQVPQSTWTLHMPIAR